MTQYFVKGLMFNFNPVCCSYVVLNEEGFLFNREHGMPDDITTHGVLSGIFNATASIG